MTSVGKRRLGTAGLEVSSIGLGCMGMTAAYGPAGDEAESIATIRAAFDQGVTLFDTADIYGPFVNEELVGRAVRGLPRDEVVIATKFANVVDEFGPRIDGRPAYVRAACEASLRRLGVDHIDLYFQHRVDPSVPVAETWGAMAELVSDGLVRYLGISEASERSLRAANEVHRVTCGQYEMSMFTREYEMTILPALRDIGAGFMAFSPLGRALLAGGIAPGATFGSDDYRSRMPRFQAENLDHNIRLLEVVRKMAEEKRCTLGQLALAWLLQLGADIVPIPGTKRRAHLLDNLGAVDVEITDADRSRIDAALPVGAAQGARYDERQGRTINR